MEKFNLKDVALRLRSLREELVIPADKIAAATGKSVEEYLEYEQGANDFSFNFLYNCAKVLGVDITELITGESARLQSYELNRNGEGMPIVRRSGFNYLHLAANMRARMAEPFVVSVPYSESDDTAEIKLNAHEGQEFDYILSGALKVNIDGHIMVLGEGDSIYYNSGRPHGMVATGGKDCKFIAVVLND